MSSLIWSKDIDILVWYPLRPPTTSFLIAEASLSNIIYNKKGGGNTAFASYLIN